MIKHRPWPFDVDLSNLDTGSITNILRDIDIHMPMMETEDEITQLLKVKELFERELMAVRRLH